MEQKAKITITITIATIAAVLAAVRLYWLLAAAAFYLLTVLIFRTYDKDKDNSNR